LRELAPEILARAIRFNTTNPPGNERPLATYLVGLAKRGGLDARLIETPKGTATQGRAAAWARLPGRGTRPPVVLLSHLDVVPADRDDWSVDPFAGVVGGSTVVGRGALDAKGVGVVHLLTLLELQRRGIRLDRDVIFLATPDEETGGVNGAGLIAQDRRDLLEGAKYLLTEGGSILPGSAGVPDLWGVTVTEKAPCWIRLRAHGAPGHGSAASPDAAPERLVRALARIQQLQPKVEVLPEVARMFAAMGGVAPREDRQRYRNLRGAMALDPDFRERFLAEAGRRALVEDTVAITVLKGSPRVNMIPAEARAVLDTRLLPGHSCQAFARKLADTIDDPAVDIDIVLSFPSRASSPDSPLFRAIAAVAHHDDPRAVVVPRVIAGFTDSHYFRNLGMVAYGFVPRRLRPIETRGIHGPNERISTDNLVYGVKTMIQILQALDQQERQDTRVQGHLEAFGATH